MQAFEQEPAALKRGSTTEADQFLVTNLWGASESLLPPHTVMHWAKLLHDRGVDFASHAAACHYWLYEHYRGYDHKKPPRIHEGR
ncbi:hypothetical protein WCQ02_20100 [Paraburkholderia tropica]|uniref:hypothetical protein n=1 Tax=Paraburkholderia tropica TaxID=92647 RepID=UPI0023962431|nr:hypothetical protein [Paraburkholderia tropica]